MQHEHEKMIPIYIDENLHYELKRFALDSGKTLGDLLSPFIQEFKDSAKVLVEELKNQQTPQIIEPIAQ